MGQVIRAPVTHTLSFDSYSLCDYGLQGRDLDEQLGGGGTPKPEASDPQLHLFPLQHDPLLGACTFSKDQECCHLSTLCFYNRFPMAGVSVG